MLVLSLFLLVFCVGVSVGVVGHVMFVVDKVVVAEIDWICCVVYVVVAAVVVYVVDVFVVVVVIAVSGVVVVVVVVDVGVVVADVVAVVVGCVCWYYWRCCAHACVFVYVIVM